MRLVRGAPCQRIEKGSTRNNMYSYKALPGLNPEVLTEVRVLPPKRERVITKARHGQHVVDCRGNFLGVEDLRIDATYHVIHMLLIVAGMRMCLQHERFMHSIILRTQRDNLNLGSLSVPLMGLLGVNLGR